MDPATVEKVKKPGTTIVVPPAVAEKVPGTVMKNGEKKTVAGVEIEAVPMYNIQRGPAAGQLFHDKGRGNGYILTLGGKRLQSVRWSEQLGFWRPDEEVGAYHIQYEVSPGTFR